jgi:lipopolysaccharide transport system ATP-binding protein
MSADIAIKIENVGKTYPIFRSPQDRLKQMVLPRLQAMTGLQHCKYYYPFEALHDISFEVRKGESLGIVGRNGSGKSTLLQIIAGTLQPTTGSVQVNGRVAALLELGSGFNPEFTGRENVYLNCSVLGLSREETDDRFAAIEDFADIGSFIDQPVKTYSSGMTMRLAFAVIAHVDADVLIVDEALSVGDVFFVQKCMRFVRNFQKRGSLLFVTHDTTALQSLCERAVWLEKGRLREAGTAKRISEQYLKATYAEKQGVVFFDENYEKAATRPKLPLQEEAIIDQRSEFINASNLRNDIKVFQFNPDSDSFGAGGAVVESVKLRDAMTLLPVAYIVGGEEVTLEVLVRARQRLHSPIVGFFLKNSAGQFLFGDNTYLSHLKKPRYAEPGDGLIAEFRFQIPYLPAGDYVFCVACADGSNDEHIQHHWSHEALALRSEASHAPGGLIGLPMLHIALRCVRDSVGPQ